MSEAQPTFPRLPRNLMLAISFGQGLALFLLWRALSNEVWPSLTPAINFPLWTLVLVGPTLLLLTLEQGNLVRCLKSAGLFSALMVLLGAYVGWQASPHGVFPIETLLFAYFVTALIACFMALMAIQRWVAGSQRSYAALFAMSWRNFLVAALAGALAMGVNLVLFLSAELFAVIGIEFLRELVRKDWFLIPVLSVAFGLGVLIFRQRVAVIDSITSLLEGLARILLPLVGTVAVVFLGALPVTGLAPLWETGNGTALLLWLNAFALFLVNAAYQAGRTRPYPAAVHGALSCAIALLPVISLLALYGLYLRIDEYGLTVLRCWALAVFLILALFSGGYAYSIVRRRGAWSQHLGQVNTVMGWVVLALMLVVNSPLLDFRSISLQSQMARVEAGDIELKEFDFHYAKHHLARPGYLEMEALIGRFEHSDPELVQRIREPVRHNPGETDLDEMWGRIVYRPEPFEPPAGLREAIRRSGVPLPGAHDAFVLVRIDLDADGKPEYVLLAKTRDSHRIDAWRFAHDGGGWKSATLYLLDGLAEDVDLATMLRDGELEPVAARYQNLKIGDLLFRGVP